MARRGENIRKRADGRWEARIIIDYSKAGKAHYKYLYGKTYREVKEKRNALITEKRFTKPKPCTKEITFDELLNDWLLFIKTDVKESTYSKYVFEVEHHIKPELGHIPLAQITTEHIDKFTRNKLTNGQLRKKGGLAPKTVSGLLSIIKLSFDFARERNYGLPENIVIHNPRQTLPKIQVLDETGQEKLEKYIIEHSDSPICIGILLSLYTGLRIGEVCALRWGDIHFDTKLLCIKGTMLRIQDTSPAAETKTKIVVGTPKTGNSYRSIPLPDFLCHYLWQLRNESECFFLTGKTSYMEPRSYYNHYKKILNTLDLSKYNYHALRHTFATRCVEQGFDIKSLSEILGHADVSTTLRRYVHPSMNIKRQQMQRLQKNSVCGQHTGQIFNES